MRVKTVTKYVCDHCNDSFSSEDAAERHEAACSVRTRLRKAAGLNPPAIRAARDLAILHDDDLAQLLDVIAPRPPAKAAP